MPASIRAEEPSDFDEVRRLLEAAFAPSAVEAPLVEALRKAWMVRPLPAYEPSARGRVSYPAAFDAAV